MKIVQKKWEGGGETQIKQFCEIFCLGLSKTFEIMLFLAIHTQNLSKTWWGEGDYGHHGTMTQRKQICFRMDSLPN